ncbi:hypothetical protein TNCV_2675431 [Trichonephila clavipes]|nr:hypothetical protein TNCV_2675431 [Trichonephila clavipes]
MFFSSGLLWPHFILFGVYQAGLGSRSSIGVGLLQGEWTHGSDLPLLISGMRNNNMISLAFISLGGLPLPQGNPPRPWAPCLGCNWSPSQFLQCTPR